MTIHAQSYIVYYVELIIAFLLALFWINKNKGFVYLAALLFLALVVEYIYHSDNLSYLKPVVNLVYQPFEVYFLGMFYYKQVAKNRWLKPITIVACSVILLLLLKYIDYSKNISASASSFDTLCIDFFCLYYINYLYHSFPHSGSPLKNPFFWITVGNLFFYNFYWVYANCIQLMPFDLARTISKTFNGIFNNFLYLLYVIGMVCRIQFKPFSFFGVNFTRLK